MRKKYSKKILFLFIFPFFAISCGATPAAATKVEINKITTMEQLKKSLVNYDFASPNKWLDESIDKSESEELHNGKIIVPPTDSNQKEEGNAYNFGHNNITSNHPESVKNFISNSITHKIEKEDYSLEKIKNSFDFTDDIDNQSKYIQNFVEIYSKWDQSDKLGYHFDYKENNDSPIKRKIAWIFASGGPKGRLTVNSFYLLKYYSSVSSTNKFYNPHDKTFNSNVYPILYNQPQYDFVPNEFIENLSQKDKNEIISKLDEKNKNSYLEKINNKTLSVFEAFQLMLGNANLSLSRTIENISESFAFISSIRKRDLIDYYKSENYEIVLTGASYGHMNQIQDILLDKSIINDIFGGYFWVNYMNKQIPNSTRDTGGLMTDSYENSSKGTAGTVDKLLFFAVQYYKFKYGFIEKFKSLAKSDENFKNNFSNKILLGFSDKDFNVGDITNYELKFYDDNKISYYKDKNDTGHNMPNDKNLIFSRVLKFNNDEENITKPKYTFPFQ
ncbi:MAG: hypothetical protein HRT99_04070 [Mycoplasmatales bacterium]|nr:hypothetical protein [Mycoplasmatales bacterium]